MAKKAGKTVPSGDAIPILNAVGAVWERDVQHPKAVSLGRTKLQTLTIRRI